LAGFEVSLIGRFWVSPEGRQNEPNPRPISPLQHLMLSWRSIPS
jgi:hypothetical protein